MGKVRLGPDGIHLFDRNTGNNILLEENIPPECSWTISPRQVSIALTNSCDLNCTHCYAPKEIGRLNINSVKSWLIELDAAGCMGIGFGGGEPLLYPGIIELCEFGAIRTDMAITLTSHGHHLNEELIQRLTGHVNFIRISMDGIGATYENIRGRSFVTLLKKLTLLNAKIPFGINYVVNESTVKDLSGAARIAEELSAKELLLLPEQPIRRGRHVDSQSMKQLQYWIDSYRGNLRLSISSTHHALVDAENPLPLEQAICAYAHIDAAGNLKKSSFDLHGIEIDKFGVMEAYRKLRI